MSRKPPGPRDGLLGIRLAMEFRRRPLEFLTRLGRDYGDLAAFRIAGRAVFLLNHPRNIGEVLIHQRENFPKLPRQLAVLRKYTGENVFAGQGDFWLQNRRAVQPAFHVRHMPGYVDATAEEAAAMLRGWTDGATLDIAEEMTRLAMRTTGCALLGMPVGDRCQALIDAGRVRSRLQQRAMRAAFQWPEWVPTQARRQRREALAVLNGYVAEAVQHGRQQPDEAGPLLSVLLATGGSRGGDDAQRAAQLVHNQALLMFNAGYDTTAAALAWFWHLVSRHESVQQRMRDEARAALGDRRPRHEDLERLPYTQMVIRESMRLYPPTWCFVARGAVGATEIDGYAVPRHSWMFIAPYVTHRHPDLFPDPERFDPERFSPQRAGQIPEHAYFPFSFGPRVCVGQPLALAEMAVIAACVLRRFRVSPAPGQGAAEPEPLIAMRPRGGVHVTLEPATAAAPTTPHSATKKQRARP